METDGKMVFFMASVCSPASWVKEDMIVEIWWLINVEVLDDTGPGTALQL